ncbi:MAG: cell division protein ZapA [Dethiobacteria bacterium]|nr:cell division protein ZapA [Bacillota bacterium]
MSDFKTRVTVNILGEEYIIRGNSSKEHMLEVASYVHQLMQKIANRNPHMSRQRLAVLTAINLADEVLRLKAGDS